MNAAVLQILLLGASQTSASLCTLLKLTFCFALICKGFTTSYACVCRTKVREQPLSFHHGFQGLKQKVLLPDEPPYQPLFFKLDFVLWDYIDNGSCVELRGQLLGIDPGPWPWRAAKHLSVPTEPSHEPNFLVFNHHRDKEKTSI